jgi:Ca2+-binding RTX toxin-like protein
MPIIKKGLKGNNTLEGTDDEDFLYGYGGQDVLIGLGGNDHLDGGIGADIMIGGLGDDHYYVDNAGDVVIEGKAEGSDWVHSTLSNYTLPSYVENLMLEPGAVNGTGNGMNNIIWGNDGVNTLTGGGGDDTLGGMGGADTMIGGIGNDDYYVENAGDVVVENAGQGVDWVYSSVDYTLGAHVENLHLSDDATNGNGNGLDNHIWGNFGANNLDGGTGADQMNGMAGDDHYWVDNAGDVVFEFNTPDADWGIDWVWSSVDFTLGDNVENLTLLAGAGEIDGTGNNLGNEIHGNDSANVLDGSWGADTVLGGGGNDTLRYWKDFSVDHLDGGDDNDTVAFSGYSKAVYVQLGFGAIDAWTSGTSNATVGGPLTNLANLDNIENIVGTNYHDTLIGDAGANRIAGGYGNDVLTGNAGQDSFVFTTVLSDANNVDQVTDFSVADDTFHLDNFVFSALADGALAADAFHVGATAADADDRIVYNSANGALSYDADGSGAMAAVQFAQVTAGLALSQNDFVIV